MQRFVTAKQVGLETWAPRRETAKTYANDYIVIVQGKNRENRKSKYCLQNLIRCNIKEHKFEQNNQEIQMLHFQQHTFTCCVTPRARFVALHLRFYSKLLLIPSSGISVETQDCPTNISLHPKVHGDELSSGDASFPTDCSNAMPRPTASR